MIKKGFLVLSTVFLIVPLYFSQASASFIGQALKVEWLSQNHTPLKTYNITVGDPYEFIIHTENATGDMGIYIHEDYILINFAFTGKGPFIGLNGFKFTDINNTIPDITGANRPSTNPGVVGYEDTDLSFDPEWVFVNLGGLTNPIVATNGSHIRFDVSFDNTPVPEPATMLLFGAGLLGLAGVNRRKK